MDVRKEFPLLDQNPGYIYFDNASTTQKPASVIESVNEFYRGYVSNIHRSVHRHAEQATIAFENARELTAALIRADKNEIIFTHNCTDAINIVADAINLTKEHEVVTAISEHHSNYLPWLKQAVVKTVDLDQHGVVDLDKLKASFSNHTKLLALSYVSNATGNIHPIKDAIKMAQERNVMTLIDAAQAIGHFPVDVSELGCDFLVFSAHKMLGPSGVGVLYGRQEILHTLCPTRLGGGMVNHIEARGPNFKNAPHGFEAGTPNIEGVIAFSKALEFFLLHGFDVIEAHLEDLENYFKDRLYNDEWIESAFPIAARHVPIFTFLPKKSRIDLNYLGRLFSDTYQICLSVGVQCCQPLYQAYKKEGAIRASLYVYNSKEEIDRFFSAVSQLKEFLK